MHRIGIDIIKNSRIEELLNNKKESFLNRVFTIGEVNYIHDKNTRSQTVAGIFAAKEAVAKLIGTGIGKELAFKDIEISHDNFGKPIIIYNDKIKKAMAKRSIKTIDISISNEEEYTMAMAIGEAKKTFSIPENMPYRLKKRAIDSHKGTFGRIGVIGGSPGMLGAVHLAAYGALRSGAGLVHVILEKDLANTFQNLVVEAVVKEANDLYAYHTALEGLNSLVLGPGFGSGAIKKDLIEDCLLHFEHPIVLDADGLNILSDNPTIMKHRNAKTVITPHPGEMARLLKLTTEEIQEDREGAAMLFAQTYNVITVLKGNETIVTDGSKVYKNKSGNPGLATAGSGDVLAGIIGSFLAQINDPYEAAVLGVYVHGLAGDIARESRGEYGMISSDILEALPLAVELVVE